MTLRIVLVCGIAFAAGRAAPVVRPSMPVSFEQNEGQAEKSVRFLLRSGAQVQLLKNHEAVWEFGDAPEASVHMSFGGSQERTELIGLDRHAGKVNYFYGKETITGVDCYSRVRYKNLYPGIDAEFRNSEYDFLVGPHARPSDVRLLFSGIKPVELLASGDLSAGQVLHHAPQAYQIVNGERRHVDAHFRVAIRGAATEVIFVVGNYDASNTLIIDPVITYETQIPGSNVSEITNMVVDAQGSVYAAGIVRSPNFPMGQTQAFVAKLTPDGSDFVYVTYLSGSVSVLTGALAVDSSGNAWLGGSTNSPDFANTTQLSTRKLSPGNCTDSATSCVDGFVVGISPDGSSLIYDALVGGSGSDYVNGLGVDSSGTIWIAGSTTSADFPISSEALQSSLSGPKDGFVARINTSSGLLMSTYLGGSGTDYVSRLALDGSGNAYVGGQTDSADFPVTGASLQSTYGGGTDIFLAKFLSSSNGIAYATYDGGPNGELLGDLTVDETGNLYFGTDVLQTPIDLSSDVIFINNPQSVLSKIDPLGTSVLFSNTNNPIFNPGIAVDSQGRVTEAGFFYSGSFSPNALTTCNAASGIVQLDSDGQTVRYASDVLGISANLVALDSTGSVYLAGGNTIEKQDFSQDLAMAATCIVDAHFDGSFPSPIAPGQIITIYGRSLGPATGVEASFDSSGELPFELAEVSVTFGGTAAPLLYVSQNQINAIVPFETVGQTASSMQVNYAGSSAPATQIPLGPAGDTIVQVNGQVIALNEDGTSNSVTNPALQGSVITIFSSGGGQTNPASVDGQIMNVAAPLVLPAKVLLLSTAPPENPEVPPTSAQILYAGSAPGEVAGVVQINFVMPSTLALAPLSSNFGNVLVALVIGTENGYSTSGAIFVQP